MFKTDRLKALLSERLTAAAEDIFRIFQETIREYEELVFRSKQEVDQRAGLAGRKGNDTQVNFSPPEAELVPGSWFKPGSVCSHVLGAVSLPGRSRGTSSAILRPPPPPSHMGTQNGCH